MATRIGDDVNAVQGTGALALDDPNLAHEMEALVFRAYDQCTSIQEVQAITVQIINALAMAGLPTNGDLMSFINGVAANANQQLINGTTVSVDNTCTLNDADLSGEMATLLNQSFASCQGQNQVWGIVGAISADLAAAGLPVTGPMMDYVQQLAQQTAAGLPPTPPALPPGPPLAPADLEMNWN